MQFQTTKKCSEFTPNFTCWRENAYFFLGESVFNYTLYGKSSVLQIIFGGFFTNILGKNVPPEAFPIVLYLSNSPLVTGKIFLEINTCPMALLFNLHYCKIKEFT